MPLSKEELLDLIYPEFKGPNKEKLHKLYDELSNLAGKWRGTQNSDGTNSPLSLEIAHQYSRVFNRMVDLGWDWHNIDIESMLPDALMPDEYYETLGTNHLMDTLLTHVRWWHTKISQNDLAIYAFDKAYRRLLDLGHDPETVLKRQNDKESSVIWYGIPLSPEKFYERNPEYRAKKGIR